MNSVAPSPDSQQLSVNIPNLTHATWLQGYWADANNYDGTRASSSGTFDYPSSDKRFEEVMAYYHCDTIQTYLQSIWGPLINRDRGGSYPGRQPIIVNDDNPDDGLGGNAVYVRDPASGYPIYLGRGGGYYDTGEDADVILHEYNHAMLDSIHSRDYDFFHCYDAYGHVITCPTPHPEVQYTAVAEAYADWFASNRFAHVEPAFSNAKNDRVADWLYWPYARLVTSPLTYTSPAVNPSSITDAYAAAPFWSDILWRLSKSLGQKEADRLVLEWAGTIDRDPTWQEAAESLLIADNALNLGANKHVIMTTLKQHGIPDVTDESDVFARLEVEHGDLSKLKVTLGVRDSSGGNIGTPKVLANFGALSGSGRKVWVVNCTDTTNFGAYFPPTSSYVWYVKVQEQTGDTVIHDQGVVRDFNVWRGGTSYPPDVAGNPDPVAWVPIIEDQTVEVVLPKVTPNHYAEIVLGHSDFSQLEMVLGVKDLADESGLPGWQLRLTKNGLTGWASPYIPATDRNITVNLDTFTDRLPPSLARRWYLGIRDTVNDDHTGKVVNFHLMDNPLWYYPSQFPPSGGAPVVISQTAAQYFELNTVPPTSPSTASASARITLSGSPTVKVGVGPTGSPYWLSSAQSSPYTSMSISGGQAYMPPSLDNRWFLSVNNQSGNTGNINYFSFYDQTAPRIYRAANLPIAITTYSTKYAYVPYTTTASFPDVPTTNWAWMQIEGDKKAGIVGGYEDGKYHPEYSVDRGMMAVFVARAYSGSANLTGYTPPSTPTFSDVPTTHPQFKFIEYCHSRDIVQGYVDGTYHPEYTIDRSQLAVYIARAISGYGIISPPATPTYSDVPADYWARKEIEYLSGSMNASGGIVVTGYGDGTYHPTETVLRDAMAVFIARGFVVPQ